jgi:hypothetical protein
VLLCLAAALAEPRSQVRAATPGLSDTFSTTFFLGYLDYVENIGLTIALAVTILYALCGLAASIKRAFAAVGLSL